MPKEIQQKIQNLVNLEKDSDKAMKIAHFRNSFMHKINSITFHLNLIKSVKKQIDGYVDIAHQNKKVVFCDTNMRENLKICHELEFKYTSLMEDVVYHTMSAMDNIPILLSEYYKPVTPLMSFNKAKRALKQTHTESLEITNHINKSWDEWIERLHEFRADIYHHQSKMCTVTMTTHMQRNESGDMDFTEQFIVTLPDKMREALGYAVDKKVGVEEFCTDVMNKSFNLFKETLDLISKDQATKGTESQI